jgi:ligand-binding SRPBCC domain-containing protein
VEIASASLDGPLALGARAAIRFRTGLRLRFTVVAFEDGVSFTDEARLPGARMGHRHRLETLDGGGTLLENTIYLRGPLSGLWVRLAGRRASRALPASQRAIVELASSGR